MDERDEQLAIGSFDLDQEALAATAADQQPRVRVYTLEQPVVVLGSGSRPSRELHVAACLADGIPLLRRRGGGCSVVIDPGNLILSLLLPSADLPGIRRCFDEISRWLIETLQRIGVDAIEQRGTSDLTRHERKIGGSCIYRSKQVLYYSTTLLVDADIGLIERYLLHPPREPEYRGQRPHRQFLCCLADEGWSATRLGIELARRTDLERLLSRLRDS